MLTDEQINELKNMLMEQRKAIIERLEKQIDDVEDVTFSGGDELDRGGLEGSRLLRYRTTDRETKLLKKIEYTLAKIENGTYGYCEICGAEIPYERLKARPVTSMCIKCKELEEENEDG
ncbi:TraR/DksA family transcriptional regulator [Hydrogenobaculum acidophilum]